MSRSLARRRTVARLGTSAAVAAVVVAAVLAAAVVRTASTARAAEPAPAAPEPPLKIVLPLEHTAYQTNERIDLAVVRCAAEDLAAGELRVTLTDARGGRLALAFPVPGAAAQDGQARRTEHVYLDGRLLAPGRYAVEAAADGTAAKVEIDVYSHVRESSFKTVLWAGGDANGPVQQALGPSGMGFNVFWGSYGRYTEATLRGGMDYMLCCTMGGGHQMDLRQECDWSDPYVLPGARARVALQALKDRTKSNAIGVHFYDEPGLTWWRHPATGEEVPHNIPSQDVQFRGAFGREAVQYNTVRPDDPTACAAWRDLARWKLGFMDAAWKYSAFGVGYVRPDFLSATQSVYGFFAFSDGYYFNVVRSLPVICGHGGYDLWGPGVYHPSLTLAMGRARDLAKADWYMPAWDGMTSDRFRLEQYASFMMHVTGMITPPPLKTARPWEERSAPGVVESNQVMARLGTIFTAMPVTRPEVATLYSLSQNIHVQTQLMQKPHDEAAAGNYGHAQFAQLQALYVATNWNQVPFFPVVEEDVLDGTLAAHHKVLVVPTVDYLPPAVVTGLETFAAAGGVVLLSDDSTVAVRGAKKLGLPVPRIKAEPSKMTEVLEAVRPLAAALGRRFKEAGVRPVLECDNPEVMAWRQARGDVEYLFAVNVATDVALGGYNPIRPTTARIALAAGGRPVYDAVAGGPVPELRDRGKEVRGDFRFGAGQMRVFALTARPIGGVQVAAPVLAADYTVAGDPIALQIGAAVVDEAKQILAGPVPLEVRVTDPAGAVRYHLYRATEQGTLRLVVPLAANDPAGEWKVAVRELLSGAEGAAAFAYRPPSSCGALAGTARRAVTFGNDPDNVFRFFQVHHDVTIVKGTSGYNDPAADRLARALAPWGVRAKVVREADVNRPRELSAGEARTWVGIDFGRAAPGNANSPKKVGFDVKGPVILLGTPEDNPLTKTILEMGFLPYKPDAKDFPGRGRGMVAWQLDAVSLGAESIALIAYDAEGMDEAVGTMYEAMAGLDPLMKWDPPTVASLEVGAKGPARPPEAAPAWAVRLPDGPAAMRPLGKGRVAVLSKDGTLAAVKDSGKVDWRAQITGGEVWALDASPDGGLVAVGASQHVVAFSGKGKRLFDVPTADGPAAPAATFVAVSPDGKSVAVGASDGRLSLLAADGKRVWTVGGVPKAEMDKFEAGLKAWEAGKDQRDAEIKAYQTVEEQWKAAVAEWEKKPEADRGEKPKKPEPPKHPPQPNRPERKPYVAGLFTGDSKTLLALVDGQAELFSAADGSAGVKIGGVPGRTLVPAGAGDLVLACGGDRVAVLSPKDGKIVRQVSLAKAVVIAAAPVGEGAVVGAEAEGSTVRLLRALEGKAEEQAAWDHRVPGRIVKHVAASGGLTAVAYWGGTVAVLDADGKVRSETVLPWDVAALQWLGGRLVAGLADGSVVALKAK